MNMFVSVGSKYDPENPNWLSVKSVIRHDAYKSDSDAHDIALLEAFFIVQNVIKKFPFSTGKPS